MSKAYGEEFRLRVIGHVERGGSARSAAARFEIGVATAIRWMREWRERALLGPRPQPKRGSKLDQHTDYLLGLVTREPGLTLHEIARRLKAECGLGVSHVAVWKFYKRHAISFKKNRIRR